MSLGMTVMLHQLCGRDSNSVAAIQQAIGRKIATVAVDDAIRIAFDDGSALLICDDGQSCCERRYLTCDDDLTSFAGDVLVSVDTKEGPQPEAPDFGDHEVAFVEFTTGRGSFTVCTHNEHNGYYGGFVLTAAFSTPTAPAE